MNESQKLKSGGSRFSFLDFATSKLRENKSQSADKSDKIAKDSEEMKGMISEEESCFNDTRIFLAPAANAVAGRVIIWHKSRSGCDEVVGCAIELRER